MPGVLKEISIEVLTSMQLQVCNFFRYGVCFQYFLLSASSSEARVSRDL